MTRAEFTEAVLQINLLSYVQVLRKKRQFSPNLNAKQIAPMHRGHDSYEDVETTPGISRDLRLLSWSLSVDRESPPAIRPSSRSPSLVWFLLSSTGLSPPDVYEAEL